MGSLPFSQNCCVVLELLFCPNPEERKQCGCVCKKCARKIVNCYKPYSEIREAFEVVPAQSPKERREKLQHNEMRSPTGFTPAAKRQRAVADSQESRNRNPKPSRKSLFGKDDQYSNVQDSISDLMNLPTDHSAQTQTIPQRVICRQSSR